LLRGEGRYTDDVNLAASLCRDGAAPVAHGTVRRLGLDAAGKCRASWAPTAPPISRPRVPGPEEPVRRAEPRRHAVASRDAAALAKRVRYAGEPVAFVVAETVAQAKDAAEAVECEIDPLPAVTSASEGRGGRAAAHDEAPGNISSISITATAPSRRGLRQAAHVTRLKPISNRIVVNAMEPRAAVGAFDQQSGPLHPHARLPGRVRAQGQSRAGAGRPDRQIAGAQPQCRRLVRHEVAGLSRISCVLFAARLLAGR